VTGVQNPPGSAVLSGLKLFQIYSHTEASAIIFRVYRRAGGVIRVVIWTDAEVVLMMHPLIIVFYELVYIRSMERIITASMIVEY
jgi:hypothetical protein